MNEPKPNGPQSPNPLRRLHRPAWAEQEPTWADAKPGLIRAALHRAQARPSGGWFVLAGSREVRPGRAFGRPVAGREVVAWRSADGTVHACRRFADEKRRHLEHERSPPYELRSQFTHPTNLNDVQELF